MAENANGKVLDDSGASLLFSLYQTLCVLSNIVCGFGWLAGGLFRENLAKPSVGGAGGHQEDEVVLGVEILEGLGEFVVRFGGLGDSLIVEDSDEIFGGEGF